MTALLANAYLAIMYACWTATFFYIGRWLWLRYHHIKRHRSRYSRKRCIYELSNYKFTNSL